VTFEKMLKSAARYYTGKLEKHGPTPAGVDWNSAESQTLRFEQLLKLCDAAGPFSINDYGCGYGALYDHMRGKGLDFEYRGYDVSEAMIAAARRLHAGKPRCEFFAEESLLRPADYTVASGIFNVRMDFGDEEWHRYMLHTVGRLSEGSVKGFAFNVLTSYSDPGKMRDDLHYADPLFWFDYCKKQFSRFVSLLHDYPLYEFTILVRK
jgi:SAM-dependent methyltransferase